MMNQPTVAHGSRIYYLDALRAFALMLGVVFHASISFLPIYIGWAVMDVSTSPVIATFMLVSHSFRMELFFLIAGFFSHLVLNKVGIKSFVQSRLIKLAVPFIVAWFVLKPLLISGWIMGAQSMQGEAQIFESLAGGFNMLTQLPKDVFVGTHLWFLYYLLLVTFTLLIGRAIFCYANSKISVNFFKNTFIWLCKGALGIIVLSLLTTIIMWFMSSWSVDTPDKSLVPNFPVYVLYFAFFIMGYLLHKIEGCLDDFATLSTIKFTLAAVSIIVSNLLSGYEMQYGHGNYFFIKIGYLVSYSVMMWTLVSISIGLFKCWFNKPKKFISYIADASYWIYLIHLPIVIFLQIAVAELPWHWSFKLGFVVSVTLCLSLFIYDLLIRPTIIGWVLNAKQKPSYFISKIHTAKINRP